MLATSKTKFIDAVDKARIPLARMAAEETGMGVLEDKIIKNHFACEYIYNKHKNAKTCGIIKEDKAICFMADEEVAMEAKLRGVTRATVSMERASKLEGPVIFAIGNAPTALIRLREEYDAKTFIPSLVIGVPVGFVNVEIAKEMIMETDIPYIINEGRKGGSNVAAALINAVLYEIKKGNL